jgi:ADP-ribose pyrophosphatase
MSSIGQSNSGTPPSTNPQQANSVGTSRELGSPQELLSTSRFKVVRHTQQFTNGQTRFRESVQHPGAVVIVPWFADERVCLIRNYRIAVGATLWELPAGTLEPNEPPIETAGRELLEETGWQTKRLEPLGEFFMSPGIFNEKMYAYVAHDLEQRSQALELGEEIETAVLSWSVALEMLDRGEIQDAKTIAAMLLWNRRLRKAKPKN